MNLPNTTQLKSQSQDLNSGRLDAEATVYISASQSVVPGPVASAAPGNLLQMQILRLCLGPNESEILRVSLCFNKPCR